MNRSESAPCRRLICAIILQAHHDLRTRTGVRPDDRRSAIKFIDKNNELFCHYCDLLGYNPEYLENKIKESIIKKIPLKLS